MTAQTRLLHRALAKRDGRRRGLTVMELSVYIVLVGILSMPILTVILVSTRSVADADSLTKLQERNRTALFNMRRQLRQAVKDSVVIDEGVGTLTFSLPANFDGTTVTPGDTIVYGFEMRTDRKWAYAPDDYASSQNYASPEDPNSGGSESSYYPENYYQETYGTTFLPPGMGDGQVFRQNVTTGERTAVTLGLDPGGCRFRPNGDGIDVILTHTQITADGRPPLVVTRMVTVFPRN